MVYMNSVIYGPYERDDGRKHIIAISKKTGKRKTVSYPKYLMERHLGRYLKEDETVDHIDDDFTNDDIDNLRVIDKNKHSKLDANYLMEQSFICPMCDSKFVLFGNKLSNAITNRKRNKVGPFCDKSCAGRYGALLQNGYIREGQIKLIKPRYHKKNKVLVI